MTTIGSPCVKKDSVRLGIAHQWFENGASKQETKSMIYSAAFRSLCLICGVFIAIPAGAATAKEGEMVYNGKCKNCHGADGSGNPAIAKMMNVSLKPLGSAEVQRQSDADLKAVITNGTGKMKPVSGISAADADNLVSYLRTLKK